MAIFRRCLEIAGKAENGGKGIGAMPKDLLYEITSVFCCPLTPVHYCTSFTHWVLQSVMSEYAVQRGEDMSWPIIRKPSNSRAH